MNSFKLKLKESFTLKRIIYWIIIIILAITLALIIFYVNKDKLLADGKRYKLKQSNSDALLVFGVINLVGGIFGFLINSNFFANSFFKFRKNREKDKLKSEINELKLKKMTAIQKLRLKTLEEKYDELDNSHKFEVKKNKLIYYLMFLFGLVFVLISLLVVYV
ncbi:hypothetical protein [Mycoplasmopsis columbina]|uniref:DUF3899 domain-containing protein n=1 Tax=Mycoplasmopsis columbina SF7 TaxID=1037410 RepID=F9UKE7_9BACT|nr:hypothetical protein [Mycoplasmopsis columbina]EGV00152.1 hypothetical protein MCSF7_01791 [Mycoplasmopsis columbina SF7]VEU77045.1 Uncharacterised protein [Mycoplasmopsis columbina]